MMNNPRRALESKELSCSPEKSCELYRSTAVGKSLMESLKVMVHDDKMPPSLAVRVMKAFDRCMYVALERDYAENGAQVVKINPKVRPSDASCSPSRRTPARVLPRAN